MEKQYDKCKLPTINKDCKNTKKHNKTNITLVLNKIKQTGTFV